MIARHLLLSVGLALTAASLSPAFATSAPAPTPKPPLAAEPDGTPCDYPYVCNNAPDDFSLAIGHGAVTDGGTAIGLNAYATGTGDATAIGGRANASGSGSVAIGDSASASGYQATAIGSLSHADGASSIVLGALSSADAFGTALGQNAHAGTNATTMGVSSSASGDSSTAIGAGASANAANSVAIGATAVADEGFTVSFGHDDANMRLTHVAYGFNTFDAAAFGQLNEMSSVFGGSWGFDARGHWTQGDFVVLGQHFTNIYDALASIPPPTGGCSDVSACVGPPGPQGPQGEPGRDGVDGRNGIDGRDGSNGSTTVVQSKCESPFVCNAATGAHSLAVSGDDANPASATAPNANAIGAGASATADNAVALGNGASASAVNASALGTGANASGDSATAVGAGAQATASSATAVGGNGVVASGNSSTAVGSGSSVAANSGVGLGAQAVVEQGAEGGVAVGRGAHVSGNQGVALGQNANASADNSVAIGAGSVADEDDTVSIGNDSMNRRLTHVSEGINATDAVNLAQMQAGDARTLMEANAYTDKVFSHVERKINQAGAAASAMGIMAGTAAGNAQSGLNRVAMGVANYNGQSAIALGYQRTIRDRLSLTLGASFSGTERVVGAGLSFGW
jgi:hypothetical protein